MIAGQPMGQVREAAVTKFPLRASARGGFVSATKKLSERTRRFTTTCLLLEKNRREAN
jgi:hypothetical protein